MGILPCSWELVVHCRSHYLSILIGTYYAISLFAREQDRQNLFSLAFQLWESNIRYKDVRRARYQSTTERRLRNQTPHMDVTVLITCHQIFLVQTRPVDTAFVTRNNEWRYRLLLIWFAHAEKKFTVASKPYCNLLLWKFRLPLSDTRGWLQPSLGICLNFEWLTEHDIVLIFSRAAVNYPYIYRISYMYYGFIGFSITFVVGYLFSLLLRDKIKKKVNVNLLSTSIAKRSVGKRSSLIDLVSSRKV